MTPSWLRRFDHVYASGDSIARCEAWEGLTFENVVGGIDVFRLDPKDYHRGVRFNKDHYVVTSGGVLVALGPFKDDDHWLPDLPEGLRSLDYLQISRS